MANIQIQGKKVIDLQEATSITGNEVLLMSDEFGVTKKVAVNKVSGNTTWNNLQNKPNWIGDSKPTYTANEVGALPSTTKIPSKTSELANDSKFVAEDRVKLIEDKLNQLDYIENGKYYVAGWEHNDLSPKATVSRGDLSFAKKWTFYLLDTTDNAGVTTTPVGKLMKGNLLRFADGRFAPTVGITEAMRAECDVELYLDPTHTNKYCDAGAYNAEAFYNAHGMAKLYNSTGAEVRVLRPWETTETKYTIGVGREEVIYVLDNVRGKSGMIWSGIFSQPTVWDGIDISKYKLEPTAISPCPVCTVGGKARAFFYLYEGETNCKSSNGIGGLCKMFSNQRTYPRANDVSQISNMDFSRKNNADPTLPYPFAEGGFFALNAYIISMEAAYKTKYLHENTLFGSGISSNDGCTNESMWNINGGVRYKLHTASEWKYGRIDLTGDICYDAQKKKTHFSSLLNSEYPKEQVMESQMVASFAKERNIIEDERFDFYGSTYWYKNANGTDGLTNLDVRVYKLMKETISAFDTSGAPADFDLEVILRMSLFGGVSLSGDVFAYWGGGYEQVGTVDHNTSQSRNGFPVELYIQPDQKLWVRETLDAKKDLGRFDFEDSYIHIGSSINPSNGYALSRASYTGWKTKNGGGLSTGQCFMGYSDNWWGDTLNTRVRIGSRFRGYAPYGSCSARSSSASYACSNVTRTAVGSVQALIGAA